MNTNYNTRVEHDLLGDRHIPGNVYWGIHTLRAIENFPISGVPVSTYPHLVNALALVKKSAALANQKLNLLDKEKAPAIIKACELIIAGQLHDQFVVDVIQGGAGTSTNMMANEIIANKALEILGHEKGEYQYLHPVEDVNASQSTNDVYPTSIKVGLSFAILELLETTNTLQGAFEEKAKAFKNILKIGRTQLQDAVPMTLGQEFSCYADMLKEARNRLVDVSNSLLEINLGATAIGTGINSDPEYSKLACDNLAQASGIQFFPAENLIASTQDTGAFVLLSSTLKHMAIKLSKICNDLRLLSSGPQAGISEINLPARAAGSSIMPGKVNPIIPEVVSQVAFEIIGNDVTISMAAEGGQLQLNPFEPIIAHSLFKSISHLNAACKTLCDNCIKGITVNEGHLANIVNNSITLVTALNPYIGYENATKIAKRALQEQRSIADLVLESGLLSQEQLNAILRPEILTQPLKRF